MRRLVILSAGMLFGATALAQNLLSGIDPDVLKGLLWQGQAGRSALVGTTVPRELSGITMPNAFSWIGSLQRDLGQLVGNTTPVQVSAAYRTALPPEAAHAQALSAMTAGGWVAQAGMPGMGMDVFVTRSQPVSQTLCRDNQPVTITANVLDGVTYVLFAATRSANNNTCDASMRARFLSSTGFEGQLPKLDLPVNPATGAQPRFMGGGSGGSGSGRNFHTEFASSDSAGNVANHFARQMQSQGWAMDASWNGDSTAGSSWSRRPDANTTIMGTLQVTSVGDSRMRALLNVVKLK